MRVTHVSIVRSRGRPTPEDLLAAWPTLGAIASAVARAGAEVTVVQAFHEDAEWIIKDVRYCFVAVPALPGRATGWRPDRIAAAVRSTAPDVIHVNGLDFPRHIRALCRLGAPVLVQDHASAAGRFARNRKRGLARVAGVMFTDERQAAPFFADGSLQPGTPVFAVPESSTRFTAGDQAAAREETGIDGDPAVLWVGRLDANKDPLTILDAIERAAAVLPGLRLHCCFHEQPLLAQVEARIAQSAILSKRARLIGRVTHDRIETFCRAADIYMLGSHHEGSGYALIEALACGLAPVVSDIPSFRALTGNGAVGALVPPGDAAGFAEALVRIARQPHEPLRQEVVSHFDRTLSFERVGTRLLEIYETVTAGPA